MKKSKLIAVSVGFGMLVLNSLLVTARPALAFNALGHRVVAIVAERNLDANAAAEVGRLLGKEGKSSLSEVSSWADEIRDLKIPRQPAHSIKLLPIDGADDSDVFCDNGSCVTGAIKSDIEALRRSNVNDTAKLAALKYLVHFVGDLHQPLHAAVGERDIVLDGRTRKLHEIWDATIINSMRMKDWEIANLIQAQIPPTALFSDDDIEMWALEGRYIVQHNILPEIGGFQPNWREARLPPPELPHEYPRLKQAVVLDRLGKAGMRLAGILNNIF